MDFEAIARHIAETIERSGSAKAVFGEPIKLQTQTIVPVAAVAAAVGGGAGHAATIAGGGGGGFNLKVVPLGYIHEQDGRVTFSAIELPDGILSLQPSVPVARPVEPTLIGRVTNRLRERRR